MLFSPKAYGNIILVLEAQSSLARSSLIWYRTGEQAQVIFLDECAIPFKANATAPYFIKTTLKALTQATDAALKALHSLSHEDAEKKMPTHVEAVHYILSSPWIASQARTLSMSFDKNTTITRQKIEKILEEERAKLAPDTNGPTETIEEKIFDVRLNGYSVSEWEGKQATLLEVAYAVTVGGADTIKRLREACDQIVKPGKVHFHSSMLLQYVGIRTAMPERTGYTLIHVHGELTDVLAVKNGSCVFFGSFPMGINTVIRKIAHSTKTDMLTADSLLSLYLGGRLDEAHTKTVEPIMSDMSAGWSGELRKIFKDASLEPGLNRSAIVTARAHEGFFVKSFEAAYPGSKAEAWAASDIMEGVAFGPGAQRMRGVSVYAIALGIL